MEWNWSGLSQSIIPVRPAPRPGLLQEAGSEHPLGSTKFTQNFRVVVLTWGPDYSSLLHEKALI